jgi:signal transduction histidine kinase/ActR/RegA family two-component response regulator
MGLRRKSGWLVAVVLLLSAAVGALLVMTFREASMASDLVTHTSDVRAAVFELRGNILGAQLEQRSELLSNEPAHRSAFEQKARDVDNDMHRLRTLTADSAAQRDGIDAIERATGALFEALRVSMASHIQEPDTLALSRDIEDRLDSVLAEEDRLLGVRERKSTAKDIQALLELVLASVVLGTIATFAVQQRRTMRAVEEERRRFEAVFENASDAMLLFDHALVVENANHAALATFEKVRDDVVGKRMSELLASVPARAWHHEDQGQTKVGQRTIEYAISANVVRGLNLTVLRDVTARARGQEALARAFERERDANRIKDEFLATVSHELRTPLTAILGWSKMLPALEPEEAKKGIATIGRNATALARLVDDVLDVSRIITGKLQIAQEATDLGDILRSSIRVVEPMARARHVTIESDIPDCAFYGDAGRLQQIFWNLLSNAVKFTPRDGRVFCELRVEGSMAKITIRDTGSGITPDFLPHVFERFRQQDSSTTRAFGGLGLGLAIVRHLVELHGGSVRASSPGPGRGATFVVELPIRAVAKRPEPSQPLLSETRPLDGLSVVVCDDDDDAREMVCTVLEHAGARVEATASADAALDAVRSRHPSVLVSDIGMPREDGYGLVRRMRSLSAAEGGQTPALALTAYATKGDVARAIEAGFQDHVSKPVDPDKLVTTLAALVHAA